MYFIIQKDHKTNDSKNYRENTQNKNNTRHDSSNTYLDPSQTRLRQQLIKINQLKLTKNWFFHNWKNERKQESKK